MSAVLIVDYFVMSRRRWDLSAAARSRWLMLLPWAAGFVTYQLINPGYVSWWASAWTSFGHDIGFTPQSWMSASILSFCVAAVITLLTKALMTAVRADPPRKPCPGRPRSRSRQLGHDLFGDGHG
jgi:NCS1 family nucleobase:cation symporter-1